MKNLSLIVFMLTMLVALVATAQVHSQEDDIFSEEEENSYADEEITTPLVEKTETDDVVPLKHSIHWNNPLGTIFGIYSLGYEYLPNGTRGIALTGSYIRGFYQANQRRVRDEGFHVSATYRWHINQKMESWIVDFGVEYVNVKRTDLGKATSNNGLHLFTGYASAPAWFVVGTFGYKFVWLDTLTLTLRLGPALRYIASASEWKPGATAELSFGFVF